jgi:hypothetical protein
MWYILSPTLVTMKRKHNYSPTKHLRNQKAAVDDFQPCLKYSKVKFLQNLSKTINIQMKTISLPTAFSKLLEKVMHERVSNS